MISRMWYGWTSTQNADAYEKLLKTEIFPGIIAKKIPGFRKIELGRWPNGAEVEFVTTMWFESLDAVKAFAGPRFEVAVVPPAARALLAGFSETAEHFEVRETVEV
jgi:heme-degrading monooxygenase HmoA